ncbi:hypothetical protein D3C85_1223250 [compost metagenome]
MSAGSRPLKALPSWVNPACPCCPPLSNAVISLAQAAARCCRYTAPDNGCSADKCQMFKAGIAWSLMRKTSLRPWEATGVNGTGLSPFFCRKRKAPRPDSRASARSNTWFTALTMPWLERKLVPRVCRRPVVAWRARR